MKVATFNLKTLASSLLLPLAAGAAAAIISGGGMELYNSLERPDFSPPGWLFPVVWTVLYLLMGYAAYRIKSSKNYEKYDALRPYYIQLAINVLWPVLFFGLKLYALSALVIVVLFVAVVLTFLQFRRIDKTAANLLIPYMLWLLYALYLNIGVAMLAS